MPFASGVFLRLMIGDLGTPKVVHIVALWEMTICTLLVHGASDPDQRQLKTLHSTKGVPFWDLNDVPLNLGSQIPKTEFLGP